MEEQERESPSQNPNLYDSKLVLNDRQKLTGFDNQETTFEPAALSESKRHGKPELVVQKQAPPDFGSDSDSELPEAVNKMEKYVK